MPVNDRIMAVADNLPGLPRNDSRPLLVRDRAGTRFHRRFILRNERRRWQRHKR